MKIYLLSWKVWSNSYITRRQQIYQRLMPTQNTLEKVEEQWAFSISLRMRTPGSIFIIPLRQAIFCGYNRKIEHALPGTTHCAINYSFSNRLVDRNLTDNKFSRTQQGASAPQTTKSANDRKYAWLERFVSTWYASLKSLRSFEGMKNLAAPNIAARTLPVV